MLSCQSLRTDSERENSFRNALSLSLMRCQPIGQGNTECFELFSFLYRSLSATLTERATPFTSRTAISASPLFCDSYSIVSSMIRQSMSHAALCCRLTVQVEDRRLVVRA